MKFDSIIKSNAFNGILIALSCLSFCAAGWYYARGTEILVQTNLPRFSHEVCAFLVGGIVPSIIFELAVRMFSFQKRRVRGVASTPFNQYSKSGIDALPAEALEAFILSERKKVATLRVFLIGANWVCFGLSFIYFEYRILYVFGRVLLNFWVATLFFGGFLFYQSRKTEKNKIGFMIMQMSRIYLATYCMIVLANLALTFF